MDTILQTLKEKTSGLLETVKKELSGLRTNRPTPHLVEDIKVSYAESQVPIKQVGSISVIPPRELQISVWDKSIIQDVAKAIETANVGLNPAVQGNVIHLNMPPLTEERRMELIKIAKSVTENFRIQLRGIRDEANKKTEKLEEGKEINEDEKFKLKKQIQESIDETNATINEMLERKNKEIGE